jgi:hypothetical protein
MHRSSSREGRGQSIQEKTEGDALSEGADLPTEEETTPSRIPGGAASCPPGEERGFAARN